jgi:hypothetical protein
MLKYTSSKEGLAMIAIKEDGCFLLKDKKEHR